MPTYTYTGADRRYYPSLGVSAEPGLVADLPELPADGRWRETPGVAVSAPNPVPPVATAEGGLPLEG
jgi:hypothetical protein